ncbi:MAG: addiction module protein [Desulfovibrio sp.]
MKAQTQLLKQVLELDPVSRAELIDAALASFDADGAQAIAAAWGREAESRIDAYEAGQVGARSAREVFEGLSR